MEQDGQRVPNVNTQGSISGLFAGPPPTGDYVSVYFGFFPNTTRDPFDYKYNALLCQTHAFLVTWLDWGFSLNLKDIHRMYNKESSQPVSITTDFEVIDLNGVQVEPGYAKFLLSDNHIALQEYRVDYVWALGKTNVFYNVNTAEM